MAYAREDVLAHCIEESGGRGQFAAAQRRELRRGGFLVLDVGDAASARWSEHGKKPSTRAKYREERAAKRAKARARRRRERVERMLEGSPSLEKLRAAWHLLRAT